MGSIGSADSSWTTAIHNTAFGRRHELRIGALSVTLLYNEPTREVRSICARYWNVHNSFRPGRYQGRPERHREAKLAESNICCPLEMRIGNKNNPASPREPESKLKKFRFGGWALSTIYMQMSACILSSAKSMSIDSMSVKRVNRVSV